MSIRLKLEKEQMKSFKTLTSAIQPVDKRLIYFLPGVGLGQVVGTGIDQVDGEESRSSSTYADRCFTWNS